MELAEDVEKYLADEPVSAYDEPGLQRLARWARHHRTAVRAALVGVAAVIGVTVVSAVWLASLADSQREARLSAERAQEAAEKSRRDSLRTSAQFAARTIAQEIDIRWWILKAEANSQRLRDLLTKINDSSQDASLAPLQTWLEKRYIAQREPIKNTSWFINSSDGTQVARVPERNSRNQVYESIGKPSGFRHRDYFHGLGRDLSEEEAKQSLPKPLEQPVHMSIVFQSTNTDKLMVAFSVPITSAAPDALPDRDAPDVTTIGVMAMTVELGDFEILRTAMLIDTRPDQLRGVARSGLVLHHPEMGPRSRDLLPPRLNGAAYEHVVRVSDDSDGQLDPLVESFRDPVLGESAGEWLAAFKPVTIKGRPRKIARTGWVVIVEDKKSPQDEANTSGL